MPLSSGAHTDAHTGAQAIKAAAAGKFDAAHEALHAQTESAYTAFVGGQRVACGSMPKVARALATLETGDLPVLVFNDATGEQVDTPPGPENAAKLAAAVSVPSAPAVGRPRLGVVAREVTLLPRHWQWLAAQPGGASAALRRLVDEARRAHAGRDAQRAATERAYRFMSAIAGQEPGFEEAARALFAHDGAAFGAHIAAWPADVRAHLLSLAQGAFETGAAQ